MKKLLSLILSITLAFALAACAADSRTVSDESIAVETNGDESINVETNDAEPDAPADVIVEEPEEPFVPPDIGAVVPLIAEDFVLPPGAELAPEAAEVDARLGAALADLPADHFVREGPFTIGVTFGSLQNPIFAAIANWLVDHGAEYDMEFIIVDNDFDAARQVEQIENFIQMGVDGIFLHSIDGNAIMDATKRAFDAGIAIVGIDFQFGYGNSTAWGVHIQSGEAAGRAAGQFINEHHGGSAQVAILDHPENVNAIARADALERGLLEVAPNAEVVMNVSTLSVEDGFNAVESLMQAYPDLRIVMSIGDGGAVGAAEAFMALRPDIINEIGVYGIDGTDEAVLAISDPNNPYRMTVSLGGARFWAENAMASLHSIFMGEPVPTTIPSLVMPVDIDNLMAYVLYVEFDPARLLW